MKLSKRVREEAAQWCSIMASYRAANHRPRCRRAYGYMPIPGSGYGDPVTKAAWKAFYEAVDKYDSLDKLYLLWAEAEAYLRTDA